MITKNRKAFSTSVNLKFDIGNTEFVQRYLPTPSHAEFLKGIIAGFLGENNQNAHIMIGPYGSGKSLAATIVADIFFNKITNTDFVKLIDRFKDVDQEVYKKMIRAKESEAVFIPVVLSGNEGAFSRTIINAIVRTVKGAGYNLVVPGESEQIKKTLVYWEEKFPRIFNAFKKSLKDHGFILSRWKKEIDNQNEDEIEWFKQEYSALSAGAKFQLDYEVNFVEKISDIIKQLKEQNVHVFIVYDEFGRFLQSLETSQIYKTMQDLQDLAEVANRSNNAIQLLLISHKNMSQYMLGHNEEFKAEFQRIEKRFRTYFVESDKATFYRIAQEFTKNLQQDLMLLNVEADNTKMMLKKYNFFAELNHQETERLIVEGSYPLHPLTLFLLPRLSTVFGQNERTLFTFLESGDSGGLINFVERNQDQMYYPHILFDYFFQNAANEFTKDESFHSLKTFLKITKKMKKTKETRGQRDLLKFITLWELSSSASVVKLNKEVLAFGTGQSKEELEKNIDLLVEQKMLRFNRVLGQWELSEGSSVFIDELIERERGNLKMSRDSRLEVLQDLLDKKFYLATDYNDDKNMTRFLQVKIITAKQVLEKELTKQMSLSGDGLLYYIIPENQETYNKTVNLLSEDKSDLLLWGISDRELKSIRPTLDRLIVLQAIFDDKKTLAEHPRLDEEISVLIAESRFEAQAFLRDFEEFRENVRWGYKGEFLSLNNPVELENKFSEIMYSLYPHTPEIRNDSINRRNLNGMQTKAIYNVLNNVIKNPGFENLGIQGQGPDYLIYATVFKNNGLDVNHLNDIGYRPYVLLRQALLEKITQSKGGSVSMLEDIFTSSPFGIRQPLIPLLFVTLLRDIWEQLMFYRNGMYVTAVDAEKLYGIFGEASEYEFIFNDYSSEFLNFVKELEKLFKEHESEYVQEQTIVIKASSGILNWLRHLPRHTQTTDKLDDKLLNFKNVVRKIEVNPIESLEELQNHFSNAAELLDAKKRLEDHHSEFKETLKKKVMDTFGVESIGELKNYHQEAPTEVAKRNKLLKSMDFTKLDFIEQFGLNYTGVEVANWSDTTFDLFVRQMQNDYKDIGATADQSDVILVDVGKSQKAVTRVELSTKANMIYENVNRILNNAGRSVPREEIEYLILKLLDEHIE